MAQVRSQRGKTRHGAVVVAAVASMSAARVKCADVELKLTLSTSWLARPLGEAVVDPFLKAFNKKTGRALTRSQLHDLRIGGQRVPLDSLQDVASYHISADSVARIEIGFPLSVLPQKLDEEAVARASMALLHLSAQCHAEFLPSHALFRAAVAWPVLDSTSPLLQRKLRSVVGLMAIDGAAVSEALRRWMLPDGGSLSSLQAVDPTRRAQAKELYLAKSLSDDDRIRRDELQRLASLTSLQPREAWCKAFGISLDRCTRWAARPAERPVHESAIHAKVVAAGGRLDGLSLEEVFLLERPTADSCAWRGTRAIGRYGREAAQRVACHVGGKWTREPNEPNEPNESPMSPMRAQ